MTKQIQRSQEYVIEKQEILLKAKTILKKEFIGIDPVINEVVDAISSWYLFPELQSKPVVINLWGLTGVGKSSLVKRLSELIQFDQKFYHFDLGEKENLDWGVKRQLKEIYDNVNGYPVLLAFDEFQHVRTLDDNGKELENTSSSIVWQLLDSGKFSIIRFSYHIEELYNLIQKLKYLLKNDVIVQEGKVKKRRTYFIEQMDLKKNSEEIDKNKVPFVPSYYYEGIYKLAKENFSTCFEVEEKLKQFNGYETIEFLNKIFTMSNSPKIVDCSKGLIFVLGNLDEAYKMSHDFNPDMSVDEFHEQSLKITIPIIKKALKNRFRNEQIARLGNTHIIYPAFNKKTFQKIIEQELFKIAQKIEHYQNVKLLFDSSVNELIYKEGVYPTQGTRPIFTTIHQIISTKLGKVITEIFIKKLNATTIIFKAKNHNIIADFYQKQLKINSLLIPQQLNLEKLRQNKQDDVQAITAVHESGHAIISAILLHTVPEVIYSKSAEVDTGGFVYTKFKWKYIARKEIINRLALYLGGIAAEKIIFGEEYITTGAESDIEKATNFITEMLKQCGMGKLPVAYNAKHPNTRNFVHDEKGKISEEVEEWVLKAMALAEKTLKKQEILLLKMADYLSDNRKMNKQQSTQMIKKYACDFDSDTLIKNGDLLYYRKHLKKKIALVEKETKRISTVDTYGFTLNKKSIN